LRTKNSFFSLRGQAIYWCAAILLIFTAFPFFWMVSTSFKPLREIFVSPPNFLPQNFTLANFAQLFEQTRFLTYFRNSVFVSTVLIKKIGIANTHLALIMAYTAFCLPFSLWLLRAFFQSIPLVLEEAALVDGATRFRAVFHVILPLALPGIIATAIFTFILAWNDYIFVRILITSDNLKTLSVGIADLHNATVIDWGMIMSGGMLITIPVLVFFIFIQRYLITGWGTGAVKG